MRVLFVAEGMDHREYQSLIKLARDVDERGQGIRLFWFCRMEDLISDSLRNIQQPVWQTPVIGDELRSIFTVNRA
jgi:hypothetical protein